MNGRGARERGGAGPRAAARRRLRSLALAPLLLASLAWAGETLTVRDATGAAIGRIQDDGVVRNRAGALLGRIAAPGTVRDRAGAPLGRMDPSGSVRDASGA
ncbi:MAG TPA: hypothetical protein PLU22_18525, partial [Polyangiaceae bacterium]|nr:hypothetical protein [Polyangiaceae bacterium]